MSRGISVELTQFQADSLLTVIGWMISVASDSDLKGKLDPVWTKEAGHSAPLWDLLDFCIVDDLATLFSQIEARVYEGPHSTTEKQ